MISNSMITHLEYRFVPMYSGSRNTVGVLVPVTSDAIGNGAYIAFANGQVITGADKSGELFYTVYPIKGISVPK